MDAAPRALDEKADPRRSASIRWAEVGTKRVRQIVRCSNASLAPPDLARVVRYDRSCSRSSSPVRPICVMGSSLFGGLRSSAFRPSTFPMFDVTRGPLLLFGISSVALPVWDQKNEAAQSVARSDRARRDRDKSPRELTSSIVPRGTSLHRLAETRLSFCSCDRLF